MIKSAAQRSTIPTKMLNISSRDFVSAPTLLTENSSAQQPSETRHNRQRRSSTIIGNSIVETAIMPYIATLVFNSEREAITVENVSDKTEPATGTELPKIKRAVRIFTESLALFIAVCISSTPKKTVDIKESDQMAIFLTALAIPEFSTRGDAETPMLNDKYPPISGSIIKLARVESPSVARSKIPLEAAAVSALPEAAVIPEKTGIKESIKTLNPFNAFVVAEMVL